MEGPWFVGDGQYAGTVPYGNWKGHDEQSHTLSDAPESSREVTPRVDTRCSLCEASERYGFFFDFFEESGAAIVGATEPAALDVAATPGRPPEIPAVAPAPFVSQPFRVPFEHAPTNTTLTIIPHRTSLCIVDLLTSSEIDRGKNYA